MMMHALAATDASYVAGRGGVPCAAPRVLVVDDEGPVVAALSAVLRAAGYELSCAASGAAALEAAALHTPDAVILDLLLPDESGVEVCRRLREWSDAPVIVVSALDGEADQIAALDAGADDYITKPYVTRELLARLRAVLRRASASPESARATAPVRFGDVSVDLSAGVVLRGGVRVHLTPHERLLLAALARHPGRVLTHRDLLRAAWGPGYGEETHYLRVYMAGLRKKLEPDPPMPRHLVTVAGVGYRLDLTGST